MQPRINGTATSSALLATASAMQGGGRGVPAPTLSVVVPVWNEQEVLAESYRRLTAVLEGIGEPYELIFINDGSSDRTPALLNDLFQQDGRVRVIDFARNFGHQVAITAGMDYAGGEAVVVIDADLQDPPEVIAEMVQRWREGYQVAYGVRTEREGESWFKKLTAAFFYRLIRAITNVNIPLDAGDFRLMDRAVVQTMRTMREKHRFMRGLSAWVGFQQVAVPYRRHARFAGTSKYPLKKMLRLTADSVTSFSHLPLQLATYLGFGVALLALLGIVIAVVGRLFWPGALSGQATTLVATLFVGGVQLICLGIIGEYLARIYEEVKHRPLYIVANARGWTQDNPLPPHHPTASHPIPNAE